MELLRSFYLVTQSDSYQGQSRQLMTKTQPRGQGGWTRPGVDLGRAGALEPPESLSETRTCPCESAEWSPCSGPDSDPGQSLLEWADPLRAPKDCMLLGGAPGARFRPPCDHHLQAGAQGLVDPSHRRPHYVFSAPVGISGAAICPHCPTPHPSCPLPTDQGDPD